MHVIAVRVLESYRFCALRRERNVQSAVDWDTTYLDQVDGAVATLAKLFQCRAALQPLLLEELEVLVGGGGKVVAC